VKDNEARAFIMGALNDKNYVIRKTLPAMRAAYRATALISDATIRATLRIKLHDAIKTAKNMRCAL
jgi:hypothetical protein